MIDPVLRRRHSDAEDRFASLRERGQNTGHAMVGSVVSFGGTAGSNLFHTVHPTALSTLTAAEPVAGDLADISPDLDATVTVLVLGPNRPVGSLVLAKQVDGLWVARNLAGSITVRYTIVRLNLLGCPGLFMATAEVTVYDPSSNPVRFTQIGATRFQFVAVVTGDYTVTYTVPGYYSRTVTVNVPTLGGFIDVPIVYLRPTTLYIGFSSYCGGADGTTLTLGGVYSGSTSVDDTTVFPVAISVPDIAGTGLPGDYTVTASQPRYDDATADFPWLVCNPSITLTEIQACYLCCYPGCMYPVARQLLLTTPIGTAILDFWAFSHAYITASLASHPPDILDSYGHLITCSCVQSPTATASIIFNFLFLCLENTVVAPDAAGHPHLQFSYLSCLDGYPVDPDSSPDCANFTDGLVNLVFDSGTCFDPGVSPYIWTFHYNGTTLNSFGVHITRTYPPLEGDYTLTEVACGDMMMARPARREGLTQRLATGVRPPEVVPDAPLDPVLAASAASVVRLALVTPGDYQDASPSPVALVPVTLFLETGSAVAHGTSDVDGVIDFGGFADPVGSAFLVVASGYQPAVVRSTGGRTVAVLLGPSGDYR